MECRRLDIYLLHAKDLRDVNLFTKMDVYVVVSINGDHRTSQKSPVAKDCGSDPNWNNYHMQFTVDETAALKNHHNLVLRLKSGRILGDRDIGSVQVPINELLDLNNGNGKTEMQHVSYSVRLNNGKAKGVLNFSYKFGDKFTMQPPPPPIQHVENPVMAYQPPPTGYPGPSTAQQGMTGYPYPPPGGYPPYGYQQGPAPGYGYQQGPATGYGYQGYPPPMQGGGYGYPPAQQPQKPKRSGMGTGAGAGLGLGLAGGLLGGMLIGDMVDDAYDAGVDAGMDYDF